MFEKDVTVKDSNFNINKNENKNEDYDEVKKERIDYLMQKTFK